MTASIKENGQNGNKGTEWMLVLSNKASLTTDGENNVKFWSYTYNFYVFFMYMLSLYNRNNFSKCFATAETNICEKVQNCSKYKYDLDFYVQI